MRMTDHPKESTPQKFRWLKRLGIGTVIFFIIKGTISTILIIMFGKGIWDFIGEWLK